MNAGCEWRSVPLIFIFLAVIKLRRKFFIGSKFILFYFGPLKLYLFVNGGKNEASPNRTVRSPHAPLRIAYLCIQRSCFTLSIYYIVLGEYETVFYNLFLPVVVCMCVCVLCGRTVRKVGGSKSQDDEKRLWRVMCSLLDTFLTFCRQIGKKESRNLSVVEGSQRSATFLFECEFLCIKKIQSIWVRQCFIDLTYYVINNGLNILITETFYISISIYVCR